jgi:poly(3-hydroxybutyrate) depolymerase
MLRSTLPTLLLLAPAAIGPTATAPPAAGAAAPATAVCERPADQAGGTSQLHEVVSGGLERSFVLRLPAGYEDRDHWPLIVALHGRGSSGAEVEGYSELSRLPAVVAYPDGAIGTGDGYRQAWQGAPYEPPGVDDVAFAADLLDAVQADYCVDPDRTYATGKSNGGGLAALLACRLPDRFAAVAPVAAAHYPGTREGCDGAPPVPVISVHGTGDATIPYAGDPDRDLPAITDQAATWAARNGCTRPVREVRTSDEVTTYRWRRCADGTELEHVAVTGGGHVWPGADVYSGGGYTTHDIETSRVVWRFFQRHTLAERDGSAR